MFTLHYGVHGAMRVSERTYDTLDEAKAKGLRWSQSNSTGHYWAQVKAHGGALVHGVVTTEGQIVAQWN